MFPSIGAYYKEPVALESGKGTRVRDFDGKEYLDFFGGILTVSVGHANDRVNGAVRAQIERLGHVSQVYPNLSIVELAERVVKLAPGKQEKVFFCTSGTEADETAVALAQAHTGRQEIIALRHGYSGRSMLAQSLTAHSKFRVVQTQVAAVKHAHAPYCYRCPFGLTYPSCELKCARDIEDLIQTTTTGQVAGMIAEPVLGVGGFITPPAGWMQLAVDIVKKYGGIFICDEVQTGFGRTGKMWGIDHEGVAPDVVTMAKGIANGYPISAIVTSAPIAGAWKGGNISTFGGNPVACAAGLATLDLLDAGLMDNAARVGAVLQDGLREIAATHKQVTDVRGIGLMLALELKTADQAAQLVQAAFQRGLLLLTAGTRAVRICPPLVLDPEEAATGLEIIASALD
jgi:4-aminobutyrate aminotransferase-like enzyme